MHTMRLQVQMLLSVASGGLVPSIRAFVPAATSVARFAFPTVSRSTCNLRSRSTTWNASPSVISRRSLTRLAAGEDGGSKGSGGRYSAAVLQDAEKRAGPTGSGQLAEVLELKPPKGTRDVFPEDMRLRNWLFGHWRKVALSFGFEEYDAPVLESEALYVRKSGEEVTQQLYNFEDKGGRRVSLRPEMTPSLARMVMSRRKSLNLPVKWFSLPQCWRYERMTRGRRREHYQWNMDIWGVAGVEAEAELLAAVVTFFDRVGLGPQDVGIKVNSRGVLTGVLRSLGVPDHNHAATCVLVDKLDKVWCLVQEFIERF